MTTVELLAEDLAVDPGDIRVLAEAMGVEGDDFDNDVAAHLRGILNPHCERTAACSDIWWPQPRTDDVCRCTALGGLEHGRGPGCPQ